MSYLASEYKEIENFLVPFVEEHNLDRITVNSLIRGSVEVLESEMPTASKVIIDMDDFSSSMSVKLKNIKVNLSFSLSSIFSFKSICDTEGVWLILAILKAIAFLWGEMKIQLDGIEAITLFALYRLRVANTTEIWEYVKKIEIDKEMVNMSLDSVEEAVKNLEKIRTVKLIDGKYRMCESILIRNTE